MNLTTYKHGPLSRTPNHQNRKVALVDFDGVIIRNKRVHEHIVDRVNNYVGNVLKIESPESTKRVNKYLYQTYGHTLIGLEKVVGPEISGSLADFNKFVYENVHLDRDDFYAIKKELMDWQRFVTKMELANIPIYIFSNAPQEWCLNFIDKHSVTGFIMESLPKETIYLKPELKVFEVVNAWFHNSEVFFIDDKVHNMKHTIKKQNWTNIVFDEDHPRESFKLQDRLYMSKNLDACAEIIS
jgi:FMN phosphatase YigB (HAD superfamily)